MFEPYSMHYYSVFFPTELLRFDNVNMCINSNQRLKDIQITYRAGNMYRGKLDSVCYRIQESIGNKSCYYYYHFFNKETQQEEALVFTTYEEFKNEIDKDLESYRKTITLTHDTSEGASPEQTITTGDMAGTTTTYQHSAGLGTYVDRIEAGDVGHRITAAAGEARVVRDDTGLPATAGEVRASQNNRREELEASRIINNYQRRHHRYIIDPHTGSLRLTEDEDDDNF